MEPKQSREVFMARRELGNVARLLDDASAKLNLAAQLLERALNDPESETD